MSETRTVRVDSNHEDVVVDEGDRVVVYHNRISMGPIPFLGTNTITESVTTNYPDGTSKNEKR